MVRVLYADVDGTLVGPGGDLLWGSSARVVEALLAAREGGLDVVPVTGRNQLQVRELCRLLGLSRGIAELGCVQVRDREVRYELGDFPPGGGRPVDALLATEAVDWLGELGLVPHDPWNEGRKATFLLRGPAFDRPAARHLLDKAGLSWAEVVDNGLLSRREGQHVYHVAPIGTGKAAGVRSDRGRNGLARHETAYVGDAAADLDCAPEVGELWLVSNADPGLEWPRRTAGRYGRGVAEVIEGILEKNRVLRAGTVGP